jgi:histidinol-phosphate phosphatase family protein
MKALILAAGRGERLQPLTNTTPKPMVLINGKPLLEYALLLCKKHNISDIAINTSYLPEKITEYFGNGSKWNVNIKYSFEPELLGTSGALNNFRDFFNDTLLIFYGDNLTDINLTEMLKYHKEKQGVATLALRKKPVDYKTQSGIIVLDKESRIIKFKEKPSEEELQQLAGDFKLLNSGIYILEPSALRFIPQGFSDFSYDVFPKLIESGEKIFGFMMDQYYFREVGKLDKYEKAKQEIETGQIKLDFLQKNKAVFLDRDGVINEILYEVDGKLISPAALEQLKLIANVKEGISELREQGFKIISISNQPGVAFGYLRPEKLKEINEHLKKELGIDEIYCCTHPPKGDCACRKPKTGLIEQAQKDFDLDVENSYMVGDNLNDIQTGQNAKVKKTFRIGAVREDILELQHKKNIHPDYTCKDLIEVADKIRELESK